MNSHTDQIKALISEIDEVLSKPSPRLPWVASVETTQQRQVLERVRTYLISFEQNFNAIIQSAIAENLAETRTQPQARVAPLAAADPSRSPQEGEVAEQILQVVMGEMSYLRANLTEPIQEDIRSLRQEQQALVSEIKQLEARRQQHYSLAQQQANQQQVIAEFLQALMGRLQESLAHNVTQALTSLETRLVHQGLLGGAESPDSLPASSLADETASPSAATADRPVLTPAQRLEQMRRLQAQSDQLLMTLDSTLSVVFEALQSNLQSYQESLSQGLEKMHNLGQQGEVMFTALVNHLAEQLGREASSYVHLHLETVEAEPTSPETATPPSAAEAPALPKIEDGISPEDKLPYPGTELSAARLAQLRQTRAERNQQPASEPAAAAVPPTPTPEPELKAQEAEPPLTSTEGDGELDELYSSLFSPDSAAVTEPTAPPAPSEPTPSHSELLEDFLVAEDSEFAVSSTLEDVSLNTQELFSDITGQPNIADLFGTSTMTEPENQQRETLADLSDAFGEETAPTSGAAVAPPPTEPPFQTAPELPSLTEDTYEQASPDENLLPIEETVTESEPTLPLDSNALQLLQADLYSLEGLDFPETPENYEAFSAAQEEAFDLELFDEPNPFVVSAEEELEETTTFEDLLADFSETETPAKSAVPEAVSAAPPLLEDESETDEFSMTLEDILASLTEAEAGSSSSQGMRPADSSGGIQRGLDAASAEKKKVALSELQEAVADFPASRPTVSSPLAEEFSFREESDLEARFEFFLASRDRFSDFPAEPQTAMPEGPPSPWYLGIDFGTVGLAAALLNRQSGKIYPIYWESPAGICFRLPSVAYLSSLSVTDSPQVAVQSVGDPGVVVEAGGLLLQNFKVPLKVGIPYQNELEVQEAVADLYEPVLQWSQQQAVSLAWLLQGLQALLATLNPQAGETVAAQRAIQCGAVGLEPELLQAALAKLGGVILGTPAHWSEAYRFNLREAVLGAGLVAHSSQIFVIEEAIAAALSELHPTQEQPFTVESSSFDDFASNESSAVSFTVHASACKGGTLILNAGAVGTELALVNLPENLHSLTYADFTCQWFPYGGDAIDQDILCQVLMQGEKFEPPGGIPTPGQPDLSVRYQLQQWLQSSRSGQKLLEAAKHLKVMLQQQERFTLAMGPRRWEVKRRELESQVLLPFIQRLNRELNALLSQVGMSPVAIEQAICTGGTATWPAIARWLRQKLPNAILIQDQASATHDGEFSELATGETNFKAKIGRVAWGLASLPLYPQVLDVPHQQYSDYFLLWELMRVVGEQHLSLSEIMRLLESRGINTRACQSRILAILQGKLPPGLFPTGDDLMLLTQESRKNPDCQALQAAPLFHQELDRDYCLNLKQRDLIAQYLSRLMTRSRQKLQEPLTVDFGIVTNKVQ